ncbi:hypothetical protein FK220_018500 [Flavobacteriaceae bacterium TP-CH-4]|uniref:Uncharacterized protein n=1 Tax=Pelagihabitans pacificus TaxID=2696054 RepID=A0A967ECM3_9FLAO|nr:hypothetical protein [Pelagihabitans pacificus]NHF61351.1 hypothetical protein [Pelagihabitans pacificus]
MKKKIGELFFQIIPVMIGVYLGFVVSNWSDDNQRRAQAYTLAQNLLSEINSNQSKLEKVIDYHKMLQDSSRYYSQPQSDIQNAHFFQGTQVLTLANSAYETGIQTGIINELPIDDIQAINQLYTLQNDYNDFGNLLMSGLLAKDFSDRAEDRRGIARFLSVSMTDVVIKETDLLETYGLVKERLMAVK